MLHSGMLVTLLTLLQAQAPARAVALTFDDLPGPARVRCDSAGTLDLNRRITDALVAAGAPSAAFITTGNLCDRLRPRLLAPVVELWQRAGAVAGNHGHAHLDLSRVPLDQYLADIALADSLIRQHGRVAPRFFRHNFLHAGPDTARANGLNRWLERHGYTVAPVTVDNNEWVFAGAYGRARARGDSAMMQRLVPAYLEHLDRAFAFAESMAVRVLGEEIPQVLLLHANDINRDHLAAVLGTIRNRGYRFISLEEALAHPAYRRQSYYLGPAGISWLLRWSPDPRVWESELPAVPDWVR
jgi:peptidoglycan/xylan/chitin deacetylase (PgdA/CDA1 family)